MQLAGIELEQIDCRDELVARWALERIKDGLKAERPEMLEICRRLFGDAVIAALLDSADDTLLLTLFRVLPAAGFANHCRGIAQRWQTWPDSVVRSSLKVLAELAPAQALELCQATLDSPPFGFNRLDAVAKVLSTLSSEAARRLRGQLLTIFCDHLRQNELSVVLIPRLVVMAWQDRHPGKEALLADLLALDAERLWSALGDIAAQLGEKVTDFLHIRDRLKGHSHQTFVSVAPLFADQAPLAEIDRVVELLGKKEYDAVDVFLHGHADRLVESPRRELLKALFEARRLTGKAKNERTSALYAFMLGTVVGNLRMDRPLLETLPLEAVVDLLGSDTPAQPAIEHLVDGLRRAERTDLVPLLAGKLKACATSFGGVHVATAMGMLGYAEFARPLLQALEDSWAGLADAVGNALANLGAPAIDVIVELYDTLPRSDRFHPTVALERHGGEKVADFVESHFHALLELEKDHTMCLIEAVPDRRFLPLLAPLAGKKQDGIDATYLLLCRLHGIESPAIADLAADYRRRREEKLRFRRDFETGNIAATVRPTLELPMRCRSCGDTSDYEATRVLFNVASGKAFICDELSCIACGQDQLETSPLADLKIMAERMRFDMIADQQEREAAKQRSPLRFAGGFTVMGREMEIQAGLDYYHAALLRNPRDATLSLGLGTLYKTLGWFQKAADCLRRAVEFDPTLIEAYYSMAQIADDWNEDPREALLWLQRGARQLPEIRFRETSAGYRNQLAANYADLHNRLCTRLGDPAPLLHPGAFVPQKAGRNDPCPCGSGKKYKKCCLK